MAMALPPRPASRFFAAFYRWTLHTHDSRPRVIVCRHHQDGARSPTSSHLRRYYRYHRYHTTHHLRRQSPLEEKLISKELGEVVEEDLVEEPQRTESIQSKASTARTYREEQDTLLELEQPEHGKVALKDMVRSLLRKVPNSVAVVTVRILDSDLKKYVPMGVAVSSLTSVTLDPPTISFNIKEPSKTLDAIRAAKGCFRVHFPAADRGGAHIVESFCQGNHSDAYNQRSKNLDIHIPSARQDSVATESLAPQIQDKSVYAAMECTLTHELPVADHVILAARVESLEMKLLKEPLMIYVDGKYMRAQTTVGTHS